nr:uncharacterized protein LOC107453105 [Parasteatoda tepidariorum]
MEETRFKIFVFLLTIGYIFSVCNGLRCYTCAVDFRQEKFSINNTCIFPKNPDDLAHCSHNSKYCKAVIIRVGGVFVMMSRTCSKECSEACTERGYGIRTKECTTCCVKEPDCGTSDLLKK